MAYSIFDRLLAGGDDDINNDPYRKLFGGGLPTPTPTPTPGLASRPTPTPNPPPEPGGQPDPLMAILGKLLAPQQSQGGGGGVDLAGLINTLHSAQDPVGYANKMSQLPSYMQGSQSPFNTGFFKTGTSVLTPEARIASEGGSATNQYAQRGGVRGVDPDLMRRLMGY